MAIWKLPEDMGPAKIDVRVTSNPKTLPVQDAKKVCIRKDDCTIECASTQRTAESWIKNGKPQVDLDDIIAKAQALVKATTQPQTKTVQEKPVATAKSTSAKAEPAKQVCLEHPKTAAMFCTGKQDKIDELMARGFVYVDGESGHRSDSKSTPAAVKSAQSSAKVAQPVSKPQEQEEGFGSTYSLKTTYATTQSTGYARDYQADSSGGDGPSGFLMILVVVFIVGLIVKGLGGKSEGPSPSEPMTCGECLDNNRTLNIYDVAKIVSDASKENTYR